MEWRMPCSTSAVYPRVGGETAEVRSVTAQPAGLSPRGRGNRENITTSVFCSWSIPAWAGKPMRCELRLSADGVYPRVGGETRRSGILKVVDPGLSPRGRGNQHGKREYDNRTGSIPAWAGKPIQYTVSIHDPAVYPRVGGETTSTWCSKAPSGGLSPRGRGNRLLLVRGIQGYGSIPAWAGKPCESVGARYQIAVYPRVGGETSGSVTLSGIWTGLSPRGRGNPAGANVDNQIGRSIPAWAGKPANVSLNEPLLEVYPRVGGETVKFSQVPLYPDGLSPRGRGNHGRLRSSSSNAGSIPAWAGKPPSMTTTGQRHTVYPRVGGETPDCRPRSDCLAGLSPRGRGNL